MLNLAELLRGWTTTNKAWQQQTHRFNENKTKTKTSSNFGVRSKTGFRLFFFICAAAYFHSCVKKKFGFPCRATTSSFLMNRSIVVSFYRLKSNKEGSSGNLKSAPIIFTIKKLNLSLRLIFLDLLIEASVWMFIGSNDNDGRIQT